MKGNKQLLNSTVIKCRSIEIVFKYMQACRAVAGLSTGIYV